MRKLLVGCCFAALIGAVNPVEAGDTFFWPTMQGSVSSSAWRNPQAREAQVRPTQPVKHVRARSARRPKPKSKAGLKRPHLKHAALATKAAISAATKTDLSLGKAELTKAFTQQMRTEVSRTDNRFSELEARFQQELKGAEERYAELAAKIGQEQAKPALVAAAEAPSKVDTAITHLDERYAQLAARLEDQVKRLDDERAALASRIQDELTRVNDRYTEITASVPPRKGRETDPIQSDARYAELAARTATIERELKAATDQKGFPQSGLATALFAALLSIISAAAVVLYSRTRTVADNRAKLSFELAAEYWRNMGLFAETLGILQNPTALANPVNENKVKSLGDFFERLSFAALSNHADPLMLDRLGMTGTLQSFWRALERSEKKGAATRPLMQNWEHIKALTAA